MKSKQNSKQKWIISIFFTFLVLFFISVTAFYIYIKNQAVKKNLAIPGQIANSFRSAFGNEFVEWLEKSLYNFNDYSNRFIYTLLGKKIKARKINARELAVLNITNNYGKPVNIVPYLKAKNLPGEGIWSSENMPIIKGKPAIYTTKLRVDSKRIYSVVEIASIDLSRVNFHLVAGSGYKGISGRKGIGHIHYLHRKKLVACMNGGFLPRHRSGGMIIKSKVFLPMEPGKATFIIYKDGSVDITVWKRSYQKKLNEIKYARQNLNILLNKGRFNTKASYWGIVKKKENSVYNWRSGIGITKDKKRLIFIAGNAVSPRTLAKAFKLAGCLKAMHMDMNISNIAFNIYRHRDGDVQPMSISERFWNHMIGAYLKGYTHDFIYMTSKGG